MHVHIASCGMDTNNVKNCVRAIPSAIDVIYLLYSKKYEDSAFSLRDYFTEANYRCEIRPISGFDFQEITDAIYNAFDYESGKDVEFSVNITGGTNLMAAAACSTAFLTGAKTYYLKWDPNNPNEPLKDRLVEIPMPKIPDINKIKGLSRDILLYIANECEDKDTVSNNDILTDFKETMSKQSLSRYVNILADCGLIEVHVSKSNDKRRKDISLTREGRMVSKWFYQNKKE